MGVPKLENKSDFIQLLLEHYNNVQFQEILSKFLMIQIALSHDSRSEAFASFDGRNRQELRRGDW